MNKLYKKPIWQTLAWGGVLVCLVGGFLILRSTEIRDFWAGMGYEPETKVAELRGDLELTPTGERIFAATQPKLAAREEFSSYCKNYSKDVSLLGCYTGGKVYVFEVTAEEVSSANQVTMAHELLHAIWERLSNGEQRKIQDALEKLYEEEQDWFDTELAVYDENERTEEMYTRAGTKLADLPEDLEAHYAKYFRNRGKIVEFYEKYETPLLTLRMELEELGDEVMKVRDEIEVERANYIESVEELDGKIEQFNRCADTAGCFRSEAEFGQQRAALLGEKENLEAVRTKLNQKITENNARIETYRERQIALGELNEALDSRLNEVEVLEE